MIKGAATPWETKIVKKTRKNMQKAKSSF